MTIPCRHTIGTIEDCMLFRIAAANAWLKCPLNSAMHEGYFQLVAAPGVLSIYISALCRQFEL